MNRSALLMLSCVPLLAVAQPTAAPSSPPAPAAIEEVLRPPEPGRFKTLFQPFRTDRAAISPDGKYLAYTLREGEVLSVVILEIDHPEKAKAHVLVINDDAATPMLAQNQSEKTPARINWMRWATPTRLVIETNRVFARRSGTATDWQSWRGDVVAFDADGGNAKIMVKPDDLPEFATDTSQPNPFSVSRRNSSGFDSHRIAIDQPISTPPGTTNQTDNTASFLTPEDDTVTSPSNAGTTQPRTLHIYDLDPAHPGAVTVVATGSPRDGSSHSVGLFSVDSQTGKLINLTDDLLLNNNTALLDRQGHIRLTLPASLLTRFPFHYSYLGPKGQDRPRPLDDTSGFKGFSVSPENFFGSRAIPLGFDENPNILYFASNLGRDTYGIYSLNLTTKERGTLTMENPVYDLIAPPEAGFPNQQTLVFDRYQHHLVGIRYSNALRTTAWSRPDLKGLQAELEKRFPGRSVEISDWDEAGKRFLFSTVGPADPGAFFIYDSSQGKLMEFVRRAPWIDANQIHLTLPFSYAAADGARISGLVTVPQQPRLKPIPMVLLCPDLPWERVTSDFHTEVQALADMGFVVVQLNGRGAWGLGLKQRQSLTTGYDLVQVEDLASAVASLEKIFNVNAKRVALMGHGHGGFIALRALQTHPDKFRCAIALDAPVNLGDWLDEQKWTDDDVQPQLTRNWLGDSARLKAAPLSSSPETVTKPILMLNYPGLDGAPRRNVYVAARRFSEQVRRHGDTVEFDDLRTDYMNGLPAARAEVFDRIEEFLNTHVYDFKVKLHDLKIIK